MGFTIGYHHRDTALCQPLKVIVCLGWAIDWGSVKGKTAQSQTVNQRQSWIETLDPLTLPNAFLAVSPKAKFLQALAS